MQRALTSGRYAGAIWLEGSPNVEETTYWLNLLIDTPVPVVGNASQRPHGAASNDGDRNIVDSVDYIVSRIRAGADGRDSVAPSRPPRSAVSTMLRSPSSAPWPLRPTTGTGV